MAQGTSGRWVSATVGLCLAGGLWWGWQSPLLVYARGSVINAGYTVLHSASNMWNGLRAQPSAKVSDKPASQKQPRKTVLLTPAKPKPAETDPHPTPATSSTPAPNPVAKSRQVTARQGSGKASKASQEITKTASSEAAMVAPRASLASALLAPIVILQSWLPPEPLIHHSPPSSMLARQTAARAQQTADSTAATPSSRAGRDKEQIFHFRSLPEDASVIIDGKVVGTTPVSVQLPTAPHTIVIEKESQANLPYKLKINRVEESRLDQAPDAN